MRLKIIALVFFIAVLLIGCTRTVIGGYEDSPGRQYRVYGKIYGKYGRSFLDETDKMIHISIVANGSPEKCLFKKDYAVYGSSIGWNGAWDGNDKLIVEFYEYGSGANPWDTSKKSAPTNLIRTVIYVFDSNTVTFAEQLKK